ncbi:MULTISPECIES: MDR family MFS transporter [Bacillus]|uniref:MDR family MFS transporter n=1 Tax=Bacillus TaxID=1386 RepID=UPI0002E42D8A|nr:MULTISPECIES: MFS transporter [Bacillus]
MRLRDWNTNLKIRLGGEALVNITFWMFFPFLAIYFSEEFGKITAGLLLIISQSFSVVANLMGGYCADRFGRKRMMVISTAGQGIAYLIFAYSSSPWLDSAAIGFICFSIVSIFSSFYWPASQAMIADVVDEKYRSGVFAIFYTSVNMAVVIGPIIGSLFYENYRFELLLLSAIMNLLLSFILSKWIVETAPNVLNKQEKTDQPMSGLQFLKSQIQDYGVIVKDRTFLLFIIAGIFAAMTFLQLDLLFPVYIKDVVDNQTLLTLGNFSLEVTGEQAFGLIVSLNGLFVVLFTISVSRWMEMYKEKNVFIASSLVYGFSMLTMGSTHLVWGFVLAIAIFSFGELMTVGIQNNFISKLAPESMRGQYFAAASLRHTIGRMLAPIAIPMTDWFGNTATFIILCGLTVFSGFLYFVMFKLYDKQKQLAI